jgi:hypothetical protein
MSPAERQSIRTLFHSVFGGCRIRCKKEASPTGLAPRCSTKPETRMGGQSDACATAFAGR